MNENLKKARTLLDTGRYTCVLCKDDIVLTDDRRGVKPLLELLESEQDLIGFSAADKVVGKAAAMLYRLMGVDAVYAGVISLPALSVLEAGGIACTWDQIVPAIRNRTDTGFCPMETAVWDLDDPTMAPQVIRNTLNALRK